MFRVAVFASGALVLATSGFHARTEAQQVQRRIEVRVQNRLTSPLPDVTVRAVSLFGTASSVDGVANRYEGFDLLLPPGLWLVTAKGPSVDASALLPVTSCCNSSPFLTFGFLAPETLQHRVELPPASGAGLLALDAAALQVAISTDLKARSIFDIRYEMVKASRVSTEAMLPIFKELPFSVQIVSPAVAVSKSASESRRKFETYSPPDIAALNERGVGIAVGPADFFGGSVENVVIRRGNDEIIRPTSGGAIEETLTNRLGATRTVKSGTFYFPIDAFAPSKGPIMLVVIGEKSNFEWVLLPSELASIR